MRRVNRCLPESGECEAASGDPGPVDRWEKAECRSGCIFLGPLSLILVSEEGCPASGEYTPTYTGCDDAPPAAYDFVWRWYNPPRNTGPGTYSGCGGLGYTECREPGSCCPQEEPFSCQFGNPEPPEP